MMMKSVLTEHLDPVTKKLEDTITRFDDQAEQQEQGFIIEYDVKAINRYQKIVIKKTKHTIWSKEQLKEVLLAKIPEKKNEIEKLYSFCTKK